MLICTTAARDTGPACGHRFRNISTRALKRSTANPNSVNQTSPVGGAQLLDTAGGGYVAVEYLFIQFAGFTFGKSSSAYSIGAQ